MEFPKPHVIFPTTDHNLTVIFLAGRGTSGEDFADDELLDCRTSQAKTLVEHFPGCKWVILGGPDRDTVFGPQPEWFDLASTSMPNSEEERQLAGLRESIMHVRTVVEQEKEHLPINKIVLAGISQGFAVASHALLSSGYNFGACVGCSGWLPFVSDLRKADLAAFYVEKLGITSEGVAPGTVPLLLMHSEDDEVIGIADGKQAREVLKGALGMKVEYTGFEDGGHAIKEPHGWDLIRSRLNSLVQ